MLTKPLKLILVLSIILAFIGQSMAAVTAPCSAMDAGPASLMMADMDHSNHDMPAKDDESNCCSNGDCMGMSCLYSPVVFIITQLPLVVELSPSINTAYRVAYFDEPLNLLYRPPISR